MRKWIDVINEFQRETGMQLGTAEIISSAGDHLDRRPTDGGDDLPPMLEPEDHDGGGKKVRIFNILWDVDTPEEEAKLPKEVTATMLEIEEAQDPYADDDDPAKNGDLFFMCGQYLQQTIDGRLSNFEIEVLY